MSASIGGRNAVITSIVLATCAGSSGCGGQSCTSDDDGPFLPSESVLVIAHRGGAGLWPENTLVAFREAIQLGVDVLEMDLRVSKDGMLIILHDATVDRTTDGIGEAYGFTLSELQTFDAGYWWTDDDGESFPFRGQGITVPTLEAVLEELGGMPLNIEIKFSDPSLVDQFCGALRSYGRADDVLVVANDSGPIEAFRESCPEVATASSEDEVTEFFISTLVPLFGDCLSPAIAVQVPEFSGETHVVTGSFVDAVHDDNAMIHVWTVNETADMERFLDLGVDGIITDFPDRALALLDSFALYDKSQREITECPVIET